MFRLLPGICDIVPLLVEEAGLGDCRSGGGFAAGYSYDAEDGEF